ncbi:Zinc finger BED domain-containing protein 5 [Trichinella papuae]|uniref:Zinc finger BED domain-containing protein 5 n=1 Tax=Trichinella papuae TaxID=268474 RepID=A0A0V1N1E1_9BILA|nr:Zinc finger BED domain-containing protein 5 [Trichinella papuae]
MITQSTGKEIFNTLDGFIKDIQQSLYRQRLGHVRVCEVNPSVSWTHCNLHRAALASKTLPDELKNVMDISVKIVSHMKSRPLQCRSLDVISEDIESIHKSFLLNTEVHWLSRGKFLAKLVKLCEVVPVFLHKGSFAELLCDERFVLKLTYLEDGFLKLNQLNLHLKGIKGSFKRKLDIWKTKFKEGNFDCSKTFQTFITDYEVKPTNDLVEMIPTHLCALKEIPRRDKNMSTSFLDCESFSKRHIDRNISSGCRITHRSV